MNFWLWLCFFQGRTDAKKNLLCFYVNGMPHRDLAGCSVAFACLCTHKMLAGNGIAQGRSISFTPFFVLFTHSPIFAFSWHMHLGDFRHPPPLCIPRTSLFSPRSQGKKTGRGKRKRHPKHQKKLVICLSSVTNEMWSLEMKSKK